MPTSSDMGDQHRLGEASLDELISTVPDWPKVGVQFKDITPLLRNPAGLALAVEYLSQPFRGKGIELVAGAESRGFIFGTAVAAALSAGFIPIRKPGKLPRAVRAEEYQLEYGTDTLEIHADSIEPGQRVLVVDDLLATGGTLAACCRLIEGLEGNIVGVAALIELEFLGGRRKLSKYPLHSILKVPGD